MNHRMLEAHHRNRLGLVVLVLVVVLVPVVLVLVVLVLYIWLIFYLLMIHVRWTLIPTCQRAAVVLPPKNQHIANLAGIHATIKATTISVSIVQTKNQQSSTANHIPSTIAQSNVAVIANKL